jgi:hypothetical protein
MCEQFAARIKPKDPRAWLIAVHDATVSICQDDSGNVPLEQYTITLSPQMGFVHTDDRCYAISLLSCAMG